jgi:membrane-associated phospholipid phosphatase
MGMALIEADEIEVALAVNNLGTLIVFTAADAVAVLAQNDIGTGANHSTAGLAQSGGRILALLFAAMVHNDDIIGICLCFGVIGVIQAVKRRSLLRVDPDIILLGLYYILVILAYLVFEMIPINYRPIRINGALEASYPSSTTLLVLSVMPTLKLQIDRRMDKSFVRNVTGVFVIAFSAFMVIGRLIAGVHWATDILGAVFLSAGLFLLYRYAVDLADLRREDIDGVQ